MNMRALGLSEQVCIKFLLKQAKQANLTQSESGVAYDFTVFIFCICLANKERVAINTDRHYRFFSLQIP